MAELFLFLGSVTAGALLSLGRMDELSGSPSSPALIPWVSKYLLSCGDKAGVCGQGAQASTGLSAASGKLH